MIISDYVEQNFPVPTYENHPYPPLQTINTRLGCNASTKACNTEFIPATTAFHLYSRQLSITINNEATSLSLSTWLQSHSLTPMTVE